MFNEKKLVIFNVEITAVKIIYKYFNDFEIAIIKNIKFVRKHDTLKGNVHIKLINWKNNNIATNFYNNLCNQFKSTKIIYDDPSYFEIEFDKFQHEYFANNEKNNNYVYKKFIYYNNNRLCPTIKDMLTNHGTVNNEYNITFKCISKSHRRQIKNLRKQLENYTTLS